MNTFIWRGALKHRNYRIFFLGQGVSLVGSWMQIVSVAWLTYRLTNSAVLLGFVVFASQFPSFLLSPLAGVFADRINRRLILLVTQALAMLQALVLAYLSFSGKITIPYIIGLSIFLGLVNAFDMPVRQAFVADLVKDRRDLNQAIALNSFLFNAARLVGPTIAGILIALAGEGVCFLVNGISFMAVLVALFYIDSSNHFLKNKEIPFVRQLQEGVAYAFGHPHIRGLLLQVCVVSLTGMSYTILMPVFARDILSGGASTLGFLLAAVGLGALVATLKFSLRKGNSNFEQVILESAIIFGLSMVTLAFVRNLLFSLVLLACVGYGVMAQTVSANSLIQSLVDDDKRGRVMSLYTAAFMGINPLGSLLNGWLASRIGVLFTLGLNGIVGILATGALSWLIFGKKLTKPNFR